MVWCGVLWCGVVMWWGVGLDLMTDDCSCKK